MRYSYTLSNPQRRICQVLAIVFLMFAVVRMGEATAKAVFADRILTDIRCSAALGCQGATRLEQLLPSDYRQAAAGKAAQDRFVANLHRPAIRLSVGALDLLSAAPYAALQVCVALALLTLGRLPEDALGRALPWFRRGAWAALAVALVSPLAGVARTSMLVSALMSQRIFYMDVDVTGVLRDLSLALVACAVAWAVEAGSRAEQDMAAIL